MERARVLQGGPVPKATPTACHPHLLLKELSQISPSRPPPPFLVGFQRG